MTFYAIGESGARCGRLPPRAPDGRDQRRVFAYRCLPLNIANAHGWSFTPSAFSAGTAAAVPVLSTSEFTPAPMRGRPASSAMS
jgi:hypothetical protein